MRVILVDDEVLARRGIAARLAKWPDVEIVAEAQDATSGVAAIREHRPDVVFLDIEMPGADGFAMLEEFPESERPLAVFVTGLVMAARVARRSRQTAEPPLAHPPPSP